MHRTTKLLLIALAGATISSCSSPPSTSRFLVEEAPDTRPVIFEPARAAENTLVHGGAFSPDLEEFYFTVSDPEFRSFDVRRIRKLGQKWSAPEDAFFTSEHDEHGTAFSPDGRTLWFSSTRPVERAGIADTWHLWRCERIEEGWSEPRFVDIPNLRDRLVSHPSIAADGTLYFHAGALDYSRLTIWRAEESEDGFGDAVELPPTVNRDALQCTPFVTPDGGTLLFERAGEICVSVRNERGDWSEATPLALDSPAPCRGNPHLSPDGRFLFFAAGPDPGEGSRWSIYWRSTEQLLLR